jgi:hypothetical protein
MHSQSTIENNFDLILDRIENGESLRRILKSMAIGNATFYKWVDSDPEKQKRYARACELRADAIFEDILEIADDSSDDIIETDLGDGVIDTRLNAEFVQRSRLRVDARKWIVSKLNPKKYGDKQETTHIFETPIFTGIDLDVSKDDGSG